MKDLDEELTLRIKTVFENYDDGEQDRGWALLREKFPEEPRKKIPLWWLSGIAACMLLLAGYWLFFSTNNQPEIIVKDKNKSAIEDHKLTAKDSKPNIDQSVRSQNKIKNEKATRVSTNPVLAIKSGNIAQKTKEIKEVLKSDSPKPQPPLLVKTDPLIATVPVIKKDSTAIIQSNQDPAKTAVIANNITPQPKKTTEEFLIEQSKLANNQISKKEKAGQKNSLEVFTGTFFNYDGNNEAKVNAGVGLNANIQISKSLAISVGAGISQNRLTYDGANFGSQQEDSPAMAMMSVNQNFSSALSYTSVEKTVNAMLLNLDIPIVLKFYPTKKQDFYISTGISSSSYLAQRYDFNYRLTNQGVNGGKPTFYEETEKSKMNGFNFANSAIFAIGINQKIGKNSNLIFEPYFKPAIGYMGINNLRINTAGLNLKFNFSKSDKKQ